MAFCSRLVEENYYGAIARLAREHGMSVVYETAFGDVIPGDILRFWKYADEAMCEFWNPHDNNGFVGSFDFKPILPCASAAHIYRKRRVSAEAFTSFELTFDESFKDWKKVLDEHYARGVTHIVYNTFTHNPVIGGKPPSSSYGDAIGSPFLREQTWWPYLKHFSKYIERCGRELERGVPVADILMYLGDDVNHKPSESTLLFGNCYKYDYLNNDVLMNALDVVDGRLAIGACPGCKPQTDSPTYRVLWIPKGTFLLPATEAKIAALAKKGACVVRGDFEPDWPSPVKAMLGIEPSELRGWYQRRDGDESIFFVVEANGRSAFYFVKDSAVTVLDPVTGKVATSGRAGCPQPAANPTQVSLRPVEDYPMRATKRIYEGTVKIANAASEVRLDLGRVRDWATVYVDGQKVADLWCEPYACDIAPHVKPRRESSIRVEVTSTWYNALVEDAKLPEKERRTWTKFGPKPDAQYHESGFIGPATVCVGGHSK